MKSDQFEFMYAGTEIRFWFPDVDDHIAKTIASGKTFYELEMLEALAVALSPGDLVVDAGANIGNHTVFFAKCLGCRVAAFEPIEMTRAALQRNISMNGVDALAQVYPLGLGQNRGNARIGEEHVGNIGGTSLVLDATGGIQVAPLDEIELGGRVALIKIDVEGMDADVIRGGMQTIGRDRPWVACEAATPAQYYEICQLLAGAGYMPIACYNATDTYLFLPAATESEQQELARQGFGRIIALQRETRRLQGEIRRSDRYAERQRGELRNQLEHRIQAVESGVAGLGQSCHELRQLDVSLRESQGREIQLNARLAVESERLAVSERLVVTLQEQALRQTGELNASATRLGEQAVEIQAGKALAVELECELGSTRQQLASQVTRLAATEARATRLYDEIVGLNKQLQESKDTQGKLEMEIKRGQAIAVDLQQQVEVLKRELENRGQMLARLASTLKMAEQGMEVQESVATSISVQLGRLMLDAASSPAGAVHLPGALYRLAKEARRRRHGAEPQVVIDIGYQPQLQLVQEDFRSLASDLDAMLASDVHAELIEAVPPDITHAAAVEPVKLPALPRRLTEVKMAVVMDEFTFSSYRHCCNLLQLTPDAWQVQLEQFSPDLLFIESAWNGVQDAWKGRINPCSDELRAIIDWCHARRIPTVFWNKEDPIHFEGFIATASRFDYVFTTDIECISRYKASLGHDRVYMLPFAFQPKIHNPVETHARKDAFCFAGAYYVRYPDRQKDFDGFINALRATADIDIYDRNHGKDDPNYMFPEQYQPLIQGGLAYDQIDVAYKGYRYNINLNSVKQSQSMFARRVYDLLGCNTITVSNFSPGLRLMFGDLVFTTDSGTQLLKRLRPLLDDDVEYRRFRLAGLRKVLSEHTYQHRLEYLLSKVSEHSPQVERPVLIMVAYVDSRASVARALEVFRRQSWEDRQLVLVTDGLTHADLPRGPDIFAISMVAAKDVVPSQKWPGAMLAGLGSSDDYGTNYLADLALATMYADVRSIGKSAYYESTKDGPILVGNGQQYRYQESLDVRCSILGSELVEGSLHDFAVTIDSATYRGRGLSIDEFSYLRDRRDAGPLEGVVELSELDTGMPLAELLAKAEAIPASRYQYGADIPQIGPKQLADMFCSQFIADASIEVDAVGGICITSSLPYENHHYFYAEKIPLDWWSHEELRFNLSARCTMGLELAVIFLDDKDERTGAHVVVAGRNHTLPVPKGSQSVRFGLRVKGSGEGVVHALYMEHLPTEAGVVLSRNKTVVLTNHYPSYDNLYRNGFIHRRVVGYRESGLDVEVFCLSATQGDSHEFAGVSVRYGDKERLRLLLENGEIDTILVHFLDAQMWEVLKLHIDRLRVLVWIHGSEVQPWYRRDFNYTTETQREEAKAASELRMALWKEVFANSSPNLGFIFVSNYFANEVMQDVGVQLNANRYEIIHNYIDEDLFAYVEKDPALRLKVLSIRPYASAKYANDLSVKAILELSQWSGFKDMHFHLLGDGAMFDEVLAPLRGLDNVTIERRFLSQEEIADLHKQYGLFLCPTRMDSQGVSRDEAMASGLVPVTNAVTAIPEFVDETCGILAPGEDWKAMAEGIRQLAQDANRFAHMSREAARRVRAQSGFAPTIQREIELIRAAESLRSAAD